MKLITFYHNSQVKAGTLVDGDKIIVKDDGPNAVNALRHLIEGERGVRQWEGGNPSLDLMDVELLAPIPELRRNIFCVGKNYYAHAKEFNDSGFDSSTAEEVPSVPVIFTKATTAVIGPNARIISSMDPASSVDDECELGFLVS